ncbi:MAG: hypothetical protein F4066_08830 [Chloroflexi bacterium]|nr:hypothetical protein [Chloroflexota bacterium]MYD16991.1 hypothetical protein [Chloroflexota bacterium]MYI04944.1 hypothetical protein [Chloroflexota bacterium]
MWANWALDRTDARCSSTCCELRLTRLGSNAGTAGFIPHTYQPPGHPTKGPPMASTRPCASTATRSTDSAAATIRTHHLSKEHEMNNGRNHNSLPPTRSGGNGIATAVRRNANGRNPAPSGSNRNGATAQRDPQVSADRNPTPPAPEALHWDALAPRVTEALAQPLDPQLVSQRKGRGGRMFDYVEGHTAIDQANKIFGFGSWGYELVGDVTLRTIEQTDSRTGEVTRSVAYSALVKVSVPGAPARTDVGFQPVTDESAEGHETAYKGCVTDALKRALRSFGDRFGNGLYGDPPTTARHERAPEPDSRPRPQPAAEHGTAQPPRRRVVQPAAPMEDDQRDAANMRAQLIELSREQGFTEEQVRSAVQAKTGHALEDLGSAELNPLIASAADKLERRRQGEHG